MIEWIVYGSLCVAAIGFAAHFPLEERKVGILLASALLANWLLTIATYTEFAPQLYLPMRASDVWTLADATCGILALALAWWKPWGWVLWAISIVQCGFHQVFQWGAIDGEPYLWWLDKLLLATVAVFVVRGGPGVAERIAVLFDRGRDAVHSYVAARERAP